MAFKAPDNIMKESDRGKWEKTRRSCDCPGYILGSFQGKDLGWRRKQFGHIPEEDC